MNRIFRCACTALGITVCAGIASGGAGTQVFRLLPTDGAANDEFGASVGVSGTTAIIGAPESSVSGTNSGAAYLFDISTGEQIASLVSGQTQTNDNYGISVGISGSLAIVGANQNSAAANAAGAAYVFSVPGGLFERALFPSSPGGGEAFDRFGASVDIDGTTAIVGAPSTSDEGSQSGAAYLIDASTGVQLVRLAPDSLSADDRFGLSVAIHGNIALIGASGDDENGSNAGAVYIYQILENVLTKITPPDAQAGDEFGSSVAIDGPLAVIGAQSDDDNGSQAGSAYLYDLSSAQFVLPKLLSNDGTTNDRFGSSVGISGSTAIVGAFATDENGSNSGSAYLFDTTTGLQLDEIAANDGDNGDEFGFAVAIDGDNVVVGAHEDVNKNGSDAGAAYTFGLAGAACAGDCNGDGAVNFGDLVAMLFEFGNPDAGIGCDLDGGGNVDFGDLVGALFIFGPCP